VLATGGWHVAAAGQPPAPEALERVSWVATMQAAPGRAAEPVPERLLARLRVLHVSPVSEEDTATIFAAGLRWYHDRTGFPVEVTSLRDRIVRATLAVYAEVCAQLRPVPGCPQYAWSVRDLQVCAPSPAPRVGRCNFAWCGGRRRKRGILLPAACDIATAGSECAFVSLVCPQAVLQGMLLQTADDLGESIDTPRNEHLRLWAHEVWRRFPCSRFCSRHVVSS
jgi:hypothetical protein